MTPRAARALVVLQARMGSTRLPGKVLARLGGRTILAHCVRRLMLSRVGPVVVATTEAPEDDLVADEAARLGASVVRGERDDVLARFVRALDVCGWDGDHVIRATADNPAVDLGCARRVLEVLATGADYAVETDLPVGSAVEGVGARALREAARVARTPYEREHVTPFVRANPDRFRVRTLAPAAALRRPDLHLTVDTAADLAYLRRLFDTCAAWGARDPGLDMLIHAADRVASRIPEVA